jgi:chromosome segregation protein
VLPRLDAPPALPPGAEPLATRVAAPAELARALALVGIVPDVQAGRQAAASLAPGQVLVTAGGDVWRWDGLTRKAGAPTQAAIRLTQANRLAVVDAASATAEAAAVQARTTADRARLAAAEAGALDARARDAVRKAFEALNGVRDRQARLAQAMRAALREERLRTRYAETLTTVAAEAEVSPEYHARFLASEIARLRPLIIAAGQYAD